MVMTPPMGVPLHGSHKLRTHVVRQDVRRLNAVEHPAADCACNLRECCDEFRLATAFGLIAAGAWNKFTGYSSSFLTVFHEQRRLGASGTLYCS
ncbi:MAG TPA: hypothetical protein VK755_16970 [Candidatus Acidoferrales bacterium]|jgi:hypothetical protein|nr:hypothetical protein [Candidatus Acidoferrales bacterium]